MFFFFWPEVRTSFNNLEGRVWDVERKKKQVKTPSSNKTQSVCFHFGFKQERKTNVTTFVFPSIENQGQEEWSLQMATIFLLIFLICFVGGCCCYCFTQRHTKKDVRLAEWAHLKQTWNKVEPVVKEDSLYPLTLPDRLILYFNANPSSRETPEGNQWKVTDEKGSRWRALGSGE